jgi:hypothetical protein
MIQEEKPKMKRLWPFLILNVIVSAATVLIVLLIWNASHPLATVQGLDGTNSLTVNTIAAPTPTLPSMGEPLFTFENVIGAGDLDNEHIHILYLGSDPLDLRNWKIKDTHRHSYTFPDFVIYKNGAFDLYTRSGVNSTIELYMGQTDPLWQSGEVITLVDPDGNTRLTYTVP